MVGASNKRKIAGAFAITLFGDFLPIQLIQRGQTLKSLPRYEFRD